MRLPTLTAARRRYLYRLANAAVALFVLYGLATGDEADAWLVVVNAALGLADANVRDD